MEQRLQQSIFHILLPLLEERLALEQRIQLDVVGTSSMKIVDVVGTSSMDFMDVSPICWLNYNLRI